LSWVHPGWFRKIPSFIFSSPRCPALFPDGSLCGYLSESSWFLLGVGGGFSAKTAVDFCPAAPSSYPHHQVSCCILSFPWIAPSSFGAFPPAGVNVTPPRTALRRAGRVFFFFPFFPCVVPGSVQCVKPFPPPLPPALFKISLHDCVRLLLSNAEIVSPA